MSKFNFVDLFCGAGGLSTGLKQAGFNEVFACDYDKWAVETMRTNHPKTNVVHEPVQKLTPKKLIELTQGQKIHLVAGGPPCQGFSTIGKGNPEDERNSLFKYFVRTVRVLRPDFVLFENVTGLVSKKNEKTLNEIIKAFKKIGYTLTIQVLEAQKYGVPQKRRRTFIVGTRGEAFDFPRASFDLIKSDEVVPSRNLGEVLRELRNYHKLNKNDPNHDLKAAKSLNEMDLARLKCIPEGRCIRYEKDEKEFLPRKLKLGINWKTIREGRLRENHYHRLSRKKPTPTLNTHNHHYFHPTQARKFTLREFACIQSFPMDYEFKGSRTSIVRQIGNAVPPLLAKAIGLKMKQALKKSEKSSSKSNAKADASQKISDIRSTAFLYS